ncbi:translocation/assembly module TamB [Salinicola endophyticus]|uniref:Translocation/assembly module TamB n=1 Tax=Salinicola endophyticus TaxID=1949083 RepID=A0ABY8FJC5_9GAMM|nr:translocation/assembly module TamB domain-containing protein [Salinicola endophyticus]WFF42917.1 translocation/assembly module TamB [Salinicola endophyticus]
MASPFLHRTGVLIRLAVWLLLWLLGLVLLLAGLALSPWGSHWLFEQAQSRGWVQATRFEGAPLDELTIDDLALDAGPLSLRVAHLHLAWGDDCLLKGRLCLDDLTISGARIQLAASDAQTPPPAEDDSGGALGPIAVPLPIEIRQVRLDDVGVELAEGTALHWDHFETGASLHGNRLTLSPTTLAGVDITLPDATSNGLDQAQASLGDGVISPAALAAAESLYPSASPTHAAIAAANTPGAPSGQTPATASTEVKAADAPSAKTLPPLVLSPLTLAAAANVAAATDAADPRVAAIEQQLQTLRRQLPDFALPLQLEVPSLTIRDVTLNGPTPQRLDRLTLSLAAVDRQLEIRRLTLDAPDGHAELSARIELNGDVPIALSLHSRITRAPLYGQQTSLDVSGTLADLKLTLHTSGTADATLKARLQAFAPGLPFDLELHGEDLRWPLAAQPFAAFRALPGGLDATVIRSARAIAGVAPPPASTPQYRLDKLALSLSGSLAAYQARLDLAGQGQGLPPVTLGVRGEGDLQGFHWQPLDIASDGGQLRSQGSVRWTPLLSANLKLDLSRLPLEAFTQAVTGQLNGQARAAFAMGHDGGWQLALPQLDIDGRLQQRELRLAASLDGNSDMAWHIRQLDLRQGRNRVTATGSIDQALNIDGRIDAPALGTILPQLAGALRGQFQGRGTLKKPSVTVDLDGNGVAFGDNRVGQLALKASSTGTADPQFDVDLQASDIAAANQQIRRLELGLDGRLSQHKLSLDVAGGDGLPASQLSLRLRGGLDDAYRHYRGTLASLSAATDYGDLALRDALDFSADLQASSVTLVPFCLDRRQGGALCLTERMTASADQGRAALALDDIPMALLDDFMPEGWRVAGSTAGKLIASWSRGGQAWTAKADIDAQAQVSGVDARGAPWQVPETRVVLTLDADQRRARTDVTLALADAGQVHLQAQVDDPAGAGRLQGQLAIDDLRFAPYRPLVAGLSQLEGAINGDVELGGSITMPALNGNVVIDGVKVKGGVSPVAVTDARLTLALAGQSSTLDGYVQSEDGRLALSGDADWQNPAEWRANVNIDGQKQPILVAMPAYGRLRIAPDIQVRATPQRLQVRGDVSVPWARLEIGQLPASAQVPSSDTVIITEEEDRRQQTAAESRANDEGAGTAQALADAGMQLDIRVKLHLGPDLKLAAYGLKSGLRGELEIRQGTGPVQLYGDVNLIGGTYTSFGQDLIIRQGEVIFSGPASQPNLQFEAIRNPDTTEDNVVAGLRVTGPASAPRLTIFSEPAMSESRALSYILRGRGPDDSGGGDDALTSALIGLSLSQTGSAVGKVGESFGVQDLSLDASGSGDDSQVVVSGYVFDDLKVSYGVGIFSPIAELTLRYRLIQNLYLQAVSGAAQALDLIYTFSLGRSGGP